MGFSFRCGKSHLNTLLALERVYQGGWLGLNVSAAMDVIYLPSTKLRNMLVCHPTLAAMQEELAVAHFTPESKVGRQLMAKCRSLMEENDHMAAELSDGKV